MFEKEAVESLPTLCMLGVYTTRFHLLQQLVQDARRFGDISFRDAPAYEQFQLNIKRADRWSSKRRATAMQETVMLNFRQQGGERYAICTEVQSSLQSVVRWRSFKRTEKSLGLVHPIWTLYLDEIVRCFPVAEIREKKT